MTLGSVMPTQPFSGQGMQVWDDSKIFDGSLSHSLIYTHYLLLHTHVIPDMYLRGYILSQVSLRRANDLTINLRKFSRIWRTQLVYFIL